MRDFRELKVWQKAHRFALDLYRDTQGFPAEERFGLTTQLRRAAVRVAVAKANGTSPDSSRSRAAPPVRSSISFC
jgi:four helix bundle protein